LVLANAPQGAADWPLLGRTSEVTHNTAISQIHKDNVARLGISLLREINPTPGGVSHRDTEARLVAKQREIPSEDVA
jgi:hypothetical protein